MFEANEELDKMFTLAKRVDILEGYRAQVALEGMSRDMADTLSNLDVKWSVNPNKFTRIPGATYQQVALEDINWVKTAAIFTIVATTITMLRKFYVWLTTQFGDVQEVMSQRTNDVSGVSDKIATAAANARTVEPNEAPSYEEGVLYRRLKADPTSKLNPIFEVMIGFIKSKDKTEMEVKRAMEVLNLLYKRIGDDGMALYMALALDKNGTYFSENLTAFTQLNRNGGDLFSREIVEEYQQVITGNNHLLLSLYNTVQLLTGSDMMLGRSMSRVQETIENLFKRQVHSDSFIDYAPIMSDNEMPTESGGHAAGHMKYTASVSRRGQVLIDFVQNNEDRAYSIWPDLDNKVFPSKNIELMKGLCSPKAISELEAIMHAAYDPNRGMNYDKIKQEINDIDDKLKEMEADMAKYRNTRTGLRPIEFDVFNKLVIATSPQEFIADNIKFVASINSCYSKYYRANNVMGKDTLKALNVLGKAAGVYESVLRDSEEKLAKEKE